MQTSVLETLVNSAIQTIESNNVLYGDKVRFKRDLLKDQLMWNIKLQQRFSLSGICRSIGVSETLIYQSHYKDIKDYAVQAIGLIEQGQGSAFRFKMKRSTPVDIRGKVPEQLMNQIKDAYQTAFASRIPSDYDKLNSLLIEARSHLKLQTTDWNQLIDAMDQYRPTWRGYESQEFYQEAA